MSYPAGSIAAGKSIQRPRGNHLARANKANRYIRIVLIEKSRAWLAVPACMAGTLLAFSLHVSGQAAVAVAPAPPLSGEQQLNLQSFDEVWTTIRDKHWQEKNPGGLDWEAIRREFRPRVENAQSTEAARAFMREMLGRLKQTHFAIFASSVYQDVESGVGGPGNPGFEVRAMGGRAIVTEIDPDSPAARAGVKPGWEVARVESFELAPHIAKLSSDPNIHDLQLERGIAARMTGVIGDTRRFEFINGDNMRLTRHLALERPRGEMAGFGNLAPQPVFFESRRVGPRNSVGYIRFNLFLDVVRIMGQFGQAVKDCASCKGLIIDLRGNPGGIGGMAMGMAGFLVDEPDQRLGTMYMRGAEVKFFINPRAETFNGPVAILVDGSSASTSEIFAGGLKDLKRARIFGTRTAAAALPSIITRLPNGDGFQYAVANYISEGGKPLEGTGVTPDVEVNLTRESLLAGHDAVIDAAADWIENYKGKTK